MTTEASKPLDDLDRLYCDGCGEEVTIRSGAWCRVCCEEGEAEAASGAVADAGTVNERAADEIRSIADRGRLLGTLDQVVAQALLEIAEELEARS
jgi:hypothetical protein